VKRRQRAFQITGLTWIVERTFAWLGRNRRLSKDYRIQCVDLGNHDRHCSRKNNPQATRTGMSLFKHPLSSTLSISKLVA